MGTPPPWWTGCWHHSGGCLSFLHSESAAAPHSMWSFWRESIELVFPFSCLPSCVEAGLGTGSPPATCQGNRSARTEGLLWAPTGTGRQLLPVFLTWGAFSQTHQGLAWALREENRSIWYQAIHCRLIGVCHSFGLPFNCQPAFLALRLELSASPRPLDLL